MYALQSVLAAAVSPKRRATCGDRHSLSPRVRRLMTMTSLVLVLVGPWASQVALSHPHSWVDLSVQLETDSEGRVAALRQIWRLDPFYSLVLLEEIDADEEGRDAALDRLGGDMLTSLAPRDFFTEAEIDGEKVVFQGVSDATVMERDERIVLHFRLPLAEPRELAGSTLEYRVYDPSYYVEVVHEADADGPLDQALTAPDGCQASVIIAEPDPDKVMAAAQLDIDDSAPEGLGRFFAETGRVSC
ncbi:DUF1007 family protein [Halomonas sp. DP8Y7-3]|uniref:DUF1007 family protein n=1 Tax=Halomonas sp. DP8Y7-3 TaxID=2859079 RepID=UPI001C978728|nr:DUF1007 family protein [Halomonas sp. DP8Y7-3]MBY5930021.1 DUF1007 family protein [Halomonas sp. DP8Y7-3]